MTERVEYDGYYLVDVVSRMGHKSTIATRGYKLKSWLNFEKSLNSAVTYRAVSEKEYRKYDIMSVPYEEEPRPKKAAVKKPASRKEPAKKTVIKKTPVKKAPAKPAAKKTTKVKK